MVIAPVTTNSGCSPPGIATRFSTATSSAPPARPSAVPTTPSRTTSPTSSQAPICPCTSRNSVRRITRNTEIGSLVLELDLERRAEPVRQPEAAGADQEEHRRRVGRGDDRPEQQPLDRREPERPPGGEAGDAGADQHADRREQERWRQHAAKRRQPGPESAVEQDHRQRDHPDEVGGPVVLEDDAAGPVLAGEHPHHQEDEEQRRAEPRRHQARQHADEHQRGADEDHRVDEVGGRPCVRLRGSPEPSAAPPRVDREFQRNQGDGQRIGQRPDRMPRRRPGRRGPRCGQRCSSRTARRG